jgi:site-specific DNA recombinase
MSDEQTRVQQAVLYLRVASAHPDDRDAIDRQRADCQRIAEKYGLAIVREYVDYGLPAHLGQQHDLRRLLTELDERRDATFVVVWDYARLAHDMTQLEAIIGLIRSAGAEVATITGVEAAARFISAQEIGRTQSPNERRPE